MLCIRALDSFKDRLYWIPGNGKSISIWKDQILGDPPLNQNGELDNIKNWMQSRNLHTLWDISRWGNDEERSWESWDLGGYPENLEAEARKLIDQLQGKSPLKYLAKDKRGWGCYLWQVLHSRRVSYSPSDPLCPARPLSMEIPMEFYFHTKG
jgi:hypothetical protein